MTPFFKKQYIAHARHKGNAPENTILLYEYVVESLRYGIIEGDVVFTKDGVGILNHSIFLLIKKRLVLMLQKPIMMS